MNFLHVLSSAWGLITPFILWTPGHSDGSSEIASVGLCLLLPLISSTRLKGPPRSRVKATVPEPSALNMVVVLCLYPLFLELHCQPFGRGWASDRVLVKSWAELGLSWNHLPCGHGQRFRWQPPCQPSGNTEGLQRTSTDLAPSPTLKDMPQEQERSLRLRLRKLLRFAVCCCCVTRPTTTAVLTRVC